MLMRIRALMNSHCACLPPPPTTQLGWQVPAASLVSLFAFGAGAAAAGGRDGGGTSWGKLERLDLGRCGGVDDSVARVRY
jgi:hypothetical protein